MARHPAFVTETNMAAPFRLCTMAAGAMLLDAITGGTVTRTAQQMSLLAGTGLYPASGTTLKDVGRAFSALGMTLDRAVCAWADVPEGRWLIVQGRMRAVPVALRIQKDYEGPHAILARRDGARSWVMDPLGHDDYAGAWWPTATLREFALTLVPGQVAYIAVGPEYGQEVDTMILAGGLGLRSDHVVPISAGTRIYREPDGPEFYAVSADVRPAFIGNADGWRAVLFNTSHFQPDKKQRPTVLYVRAADAGAPERVPVSDDAGALQREVQAWLADCPVPLPK